MGNCFAAPLKSFSPSDTTLSSAGTSKSSHYTNSTGKLSNSSSSTTSGQSSGSSAHEVYRVGRIFEQPNLHIFTFNELKCATRNFRPDMILGEGGFGRVFKGWLDEKTLSPTKGGAGMVVAVKKLHPQSMQGYEEWQSEVDFLGRLSHPNLVKLLGYCWEDKELLLIYEFMAKGSLENHLFRRSFQPLSWSLRLKIAIGAARGLAFLHASEKQVIYRDFKASNILLDPNYIPKLSDFGLAKNGPTGSKSHVTTRIIGTQGYAAPEYVATGHLYVKSDVYGFGVVLLEMLSGQRALDKNRPSDQHSLVDWAKPYLSDRRKLTRMMDLRLEGQYPLKAAHRAALLTLKCLATEPKHRPSMKEVLETLEQIEATNGRSRESVAKSSEQMTQSHGRVPRNHRSSLHPRHGNVSPGARASSQAPRVR